MQEPKVSVIIPAYNASRYISDTIKSVVASNYTNWECIIVDDGSTDNTLEVAKMHTRLDQRFILLDQPNSGPSVARNYAISKSTGKYILPLDADDLISPDYMRLTVEVLENHPEVKVVYSNAHKFGYRKGFWKLPDYSLKELLKENMIFCSALYRRSDYDKTRGYDPLLRTGREDWDFWLELLKPGGEVQKLPGVHFYYRTHKKSRDKDANQKLAGIRKHIYNNHRELYAYFFENPIQIFHEHQFFKKKYNLLRRLTLRKPID
ncbi:MAG TPA: glycosyltransferase family A protein [Bacteroidales bacterium]|nr:glycosyltransferase family A protein [Bacteroidales bacterium]